MIGYCKPDKEELRVKDYRKYYGYYCTLCHTLSYKYGFIYRLILSNDATFLFVCLDALANDKTMLKGNCPINPFKRSRIQANKAAAEYSAYINYYLIERYLLDHIKDEKRLILKFFFSLLYRVVSSNSNYKRDKALYSNVTQELDILFEELDQKEKNRCSFDDITNRFGDITRTFAKGFSGYVEGLDIESFEHILFNMGKWLYMADALDDYRKDLRSNSFNLLHTIQQSENRLVSDEKDMIDLYIQKCAIIVLMLQAKMTDAYHAVEWKDSKEIILNFLSFGVQNTWRTIMKKRYIGKEKAS